MEMPNGISRLEHEGEAAEEGACKSEEAEGVSELQTCSTCTGVLRRGRGGLRRRVAASGRGGLAEASVDGATAGIGGGACVAGSA